MIKPFFFIDCIVTCNTIIDLGNRDEGFGEAASGVKPLSVCIFAYAYPFSTCNAFTLGCRSSLLKLSSSPPA